MSKRITREIYVDSGYNKQGRRIWYTGDAVPDDLEEAGVLEADVGARFDQQLSGIDPKLKIDMDPSAHRDLRPEMMFIREELRQAKWQTLAVRRTALKNLLLKDFIEEDCELRNLGLAYAPPDP